MQLNSYINFNGNCAEALEFYKKNLDAKVQMTMTHGESPMAAMVGPDWQDKIMHATFTVGDSLVMASDTPPQHFSRSSGFALNIATKSVDEAERVFAAMSEGGEVSMPLQEMFWAARFGMFRDKFGIPWMVNCERAAA